MQHLADSGLSKAINKLASHKDASVAAAAKSLVDNWRALLKSKGSAGPTKRPAPESAPEPAKRPAPEAPTEPAKPEIAKPEPAPPASTASTSAAADDSSSKCRPFTSTLDKTRDLVREKLQKAFLDGTRKNAVQLRGHDVDVSAMAEEAESAMFDAFGGTTKEYKGRFRTLQFNLCDEKNPEFILSVVSGQTHVAHLATMDVKEMASDEARMHTHLCTARARRSPAVGRHPAVATCQVKKQRKDWGEYAKMALMDQKSYNKYAGKEVQDGILSCPRCKSKKTEYVEVQTRSADEPTTKKCLCNDCEYRWKFC